MLSHLQYDQQSNHSDASLCIQSIHWEITRQQKHNSGNLNTTSLNRNKVESDVGLYLASSTLLTHPSNSNQSTALIVAESCLKVWRNHEISKTANNSRRSSISNGNGENTRMSIEKAHEVHSSTIAPQTGYKILIVKQINGACHQSWKPVNLVESFLKSSSSEGRYFKRSFENISKEAT